MSKYGNIFNFMSMRPYSSRRALSIFILAVDLKLYLKYCKKILLFALLFHIFITKKINKVF
jgi:hypothetical protein